MSLPFVMLGHTEERVGASFIDYDFEAAVRIALDHLVALGHRHIGYVSADAVAGEPARTDDAGAPCVRERLHRARPSSTATTTPTTTCGTSAS